MSIACAGRVLVATYIKVMFIIGNPHLVVLIGRFGHPVEPEVYMLLDDDMRLTDGCVNAGI